MSRPWAEMGICDDWSYIRTSQLLAQTGHIHYVGWAAAIVGWQLYLGAALIKLFGFSFSTARISTLLIGAATAFLLQRTLVRLGIRDRNATLGTLTFVLSPLFMMLSATFMTDVPGFFAILLCLYGCLRALQTSTDRHAVLWLTLAVLSNAVCGTSRQPAWLGILVILPCILWLLRSRRSVVYPGLVLTALGYAFVVVAMHWFAHQPYSQVDSFALRLAAGTTASRLITVYGRALLEMVLLLLPIAAMYLLEVPRWTRRATAPLATVALLAVLLYLFHPKAQWNALLNPFMGDWVGIRGTFEAASLVGQPPIVIGHYLHILLGLLTLGSLVCVVVSFWPPRPLQNSVPAGTLPWHQLVVLTVPFSLAYAVLLIHRAETALLYDRYFLPLLFVLLCFLLRYYQNYLHARLPAVSALLVAVLACSGIIYTHNLFALSRARVAITSQILAAGVPDTAIDFGWEQDGWVELQHSAYINGPSIPTPPGAYHLIPDPHLPGCHEKLPQFGLYPHLAPRYGIAFDPSACDGPAPFASVSYSTWPLRKPTTLYVVRYPAPWKPESDYAAPVR